MSYMDALWIKIINSYSKCPPSHTQSLSLCGHPSVELRNWKICICLGRQWPQILTCPKTSNIYTYMHLPSVETALNFQYWDVSTCKPSPEAWTTICSPMGLGPDLQKGNLKWRWSLEHLSPETARFSVPRVLGLSPVGSSSSVHGRGS